MNALPNPAPAALAVMFIAPAGVVYAAPAADPPMLPAVSVKDNGPAVVTLDPFAPSRKLRAALKVTVLDPFIPPLTLISFAVVVNTTSVADTLPAPAVVMVSLAVTFKVLFTEVFVAPKV